MTYWTPDPLSGLAWLCSGALLHAPFMEAEQATEPVPPLPEPQLDNAPVDQSGQEMPDVHEAQPSADTAANGVEGDPALADSAEPAARVDDGSAAEQNGHETAGKAEASSEDARYLMFVPLYGKLHTIPVALPRLSRCPTSICVAWSPMTEDLCRDLEHKKESAPSPDDHKDASSRDKRHSERSDRDSEKHKDKESSRSHDKERGRDKERSKGSSRDKDGGRDRRHRSRERDRERDSDRSRGKDRDRSDRDRDDRKHRSSSRRDKDRDRSRDRSRRHRSRSRSPRRRSRSAPHPTPSVAQRAQASQTFAWIVFARRTLLMPGAQLHDCCHGHSSS